MAPANNNLLDALRVDRSELTTGIAGPKRLARVSEAISWEGGTDDNRRYYTIFTKGEYSIRLGKPGKEALPTYNRCRYKDGHSGNNPNDMKPSVFKNEERQNEQIESFKDIFEELQSLGRADEGALELIACLLFRSAYMIDHREASPGLWRYEIPTEILNAITEKLPTADGIPMEVFLHFLDALAWNEDVKYHTLGYDIRLGTGRRNNLMTCVNLIGVLLNRVSIADFAGKFGRPPSGISDIAQSEAFVIFPLLG